MPELPEVETTRRRLERRLVGRRIERFTVRCAALRFPVEAAIPDRLSGARVTAVGRRGKYLILVTDRGAAISHLGMSGRWSIVPAEEALDRHDHLDGALEGGESLRYHDPRRFGALLWGGSDPERHPRLAALGPEPLGAEPAVIGDLLHRAARGRSAPLRNLLLDGTVVAGVGNIYANEAAYRAGIRPTSAARRIARHRYRALATALAAVLAEAIERGGTTLRDYADPDGNAGEYGAACAVYGREGEPCPGCGGTIRRVAISGRSAFFCPRCQR